MFLGSRLVAEEVVEGQTRGIASCTSLLFKPPSANGRDSQDTLRLSTAAPAFAIHLHRTMSRIANASEVTRL